MLNANTQSQVSWPERAIERFAELNDSLLVPTQTMLQQIVAEPGMHAKLLNTLALLEHTGSYRIMVSQHNTGCDQPTLRHLAEEAQHASFMKRQAEKTAGRSLEFEAQDLLAGDTARRYFRRLEAVIHNRLRPASDTKATYLYMSMIIEFRALWFYTYYQQALKAAGNAISLKRILGEEANHLAEMALQLEAIGELRDQSVDEFLAAERHLYTQLLNSLQSTTVAQAMQP